jgi:hypothetical protein
MTTNLFEDFDPYPPSNGNKIQFELKEDGLIPYLEFSRRYKS